jgi:hypothetical protein
MSRPRGVDRLHECILELRTRCAWPASDFQVRLLYSDFVFFFLFRAQYMSSFFTCCLEMRKGKRE